MQQQPSLLRAAFNAATWTLVGHGSSQVLRLVGNLLLTRLLMPESFGVMSVATVISIAVVMFSDLGLRQVLVRSDRVNDPTFVNTVWTLQVLQGLAMAVLLLAAAAGLAIAQHLGVPDPASTYASADLPLLVAGLSAGSILAGLESTRIATAEKDLLLRPVVMIEVGSQAAGLVAMCVAALLHPSVFALLLGALVSGVIKVAASHLLPRGVANRFRLDRAVVRQVCHISGWIVVSSALTFLANNLDKLLLASLLSSHVMGQFAIAALLVGAVTDVVARISSRVAFPVITRAFERDRAGLARAYDRVRMPIDAFCLSLAAFLFWFGDDCVRLLYDARYAQAGVFLNILGVALVGARYCVVPYVYLLLGHTRLMAAEQGIRLVGLVLGIALGWRLHGVNGAVWGVALGQLAGSVAGLLLFQPRLGLVSIRRELIGVALFAGALGVCGLASR